MITCLRCGRVNDGRYRFCLGCGAALPQQKRESHAPPRAPPPPGPSGAPGGGGFSLPQRSTPSSPARAAMAVSAVPAPTFRARSAPIDDDESSTMAIEPVNATPPGTARPAEPASVVARHTAPPRSMPGPSIPGPSVPEPSMPSGPHGTNLRSPAPESAALTCNNCSARIPEGHSFCGVCGTPYKAGAEAEAAPAPAARTAGAGHLALIDDLGSESVRYALIGGENMIGRSESCEVPFPQDGLLADKHCLIDTKETPFRLRPVDFCNGTYLRISTPVELQHGDIVRVGQEVLRFERIEEIEPEANPISGKPATVGCPMPRGVWGRLCQIGMTRQVANAYLLSHRDVFLGRERGDILFPKDGFVSGSHAVISERGGRVYLKDLGSSNGTFLRIKQEIALRNGDLLLLGRNLLRVHVGGS